MMANAALMAAMAWSGRMKPPELLVLLLLLGLGSAIHLPGWQTLLQDLVTRDKTAAAVSLNSISFNLARAIGPALGDSSSVRSARRGFLPSMRSPSWPCWLGSNACLPIWSRLPAGRRPPVPSCVRLPRGGGS